MSTYESNSMALSSDCQDLLLGYRVCVQPSKDAVQSSSKVAKTTNIEENDSTSHVKASSSPTSDRNFSSSMRAMNSDQVQHTQMSSSLRKITSDHANAQRSTSSVIAMTSSHATSKPMPSSQRAAATEKSLMSAAGHDGSNDNVIIEAVLSPQTTVIKVTMTQMHTLNRQGAIRLKTMITDSTMVREATIFTTRTGDGKSAQTAVSHTSTKHNESTLLHHTTNLSANHTLIFATATRGNDGSLDAITTDQVKTAMSSSAPTPQETLIMSILEDGTTTQSRIITFTPSADQTSSSQAHFQNVPAHTAEVKSSFDEASGTPTAASTAVHSSSYQEGAKTASSIKLQASSMSRAVDSSSAAKAISSFVSKAMASSAPSKAMSTLAFTVIASSSATVAVSSSASKAFEFSFAPIEMSSSISKFVESSSAPTAQSLSKVSVSSSAAHRDAPSAEFHSAATPPSVHQTSSAIALETSAPSPVAKQASSIQQEAAAPVPTPQADIPHFVQGNLLPRRNVDYSVHGDDINTKQEAGVPEGNSTLKDKTVSSMAPSSSKIAPIPPPAALSEVKTTVSRKMGSGQTHHITSRTMTISSIVASSSGKSSDKETQEKSSISASKLTMSAVMSSLASKLSNNATISSLKAATATMVSPLPSATAVSGTDKYIMYSGDGSENAGWPSMDKWVSFDDMFEANTPKMKVSCSQWGVDDNTDEEVADMKGAIVEISKAAEVDPRFVLAIIMQESTGCVRVITTQYSVSNPGLMQSHAGNGTCNTNSAAVGAVGTDRAAAANTILSPCPQSEIKQMITDGTNGTASGDGLKQVLSKAGGTNASRYYKAARMYNGGSIDDSGDLGKGCCTLCYASDIANRLTGWVMAPQECNLSAKDILRQEKHW
ncbi:Hypothetical protein R9X50_00711000 [Acrodontium crateriforme]|uniref:Uncharacterized protein n=1 Tax=Acrodontium crateriforme TaxID=150365 RepID=A0AAQ3R7B6_9PEZI|nr:Hypothetical protein R9X50_00711000 [Acrodontium crateriforme]